MLIQVFKMFNVIKYIDIAEESRLFRESADVFNMLVSIYGSKDLFVKEYQNLLAERLLSNGWERHIQSEFTYLETMKRRLIDGELNNCEVCFIYLCYIIHLIKVMLKDIRDSWKLAKFAASSMPFPMSPRIISFVYWPEVQSITNNQKLPTSLFHEALIAYEKVYNQHRAGRNITWRFDSGNQVELELEIDGKRVEIEAPLVQAELIILFTEKGKIFKNFLHKKIPNFRAVDFPGFS